MHTPDLEFHPLVPQRAAELITLPEAPAVPTAGEAEEALRAMVMHAHVEGMLEPADDNVVRGATWSPPPLLHRFPRLRVDFAQASATLTAYAASRREVIRLVLSPPAAGTLLPSRFSLALAGTGCLSVLQGADGSERLIWSVDVAGTTHELVAERIPDEPCPWRTELIAANGRRDPDARMSYADPRSAFAALARLVPLGDGYVGESPVARLRT